MATGSAIQELVWLADTPVASVRPAAPGGFAVYYIWADHLNTPRVVSDTSNQVRWEWANANPFGAHLPNENPGGVEAFTFNLRFPGQYFDQETGLHYNYFRDYDPAIGRYVQSDPIGLDGGLNTYGYAYDSPLRRVDSFGLEPGTLRQRGYPPSHPPCGTPGAGGGDKDSDWFIPDLYPSACEAHDQCYARPGKSRLHCDNQLWVNAFPRAGHGRMPSDRPSSGSV